jgi:hypothetical protein
MKSFRTPGFISTSALFLENDLFVLFHEFQAFCTEQRFEYFDQVYMDKANLKSAARDP